MRLECIFLLCGVPQLQLGHGDANSIIRDEACNYCFSDNYDGVDNQRKQLLFVDEYERQDNTALLIFTGCWIIFISL